MTYIEKEFVKEDYYRFKSQLKIYLKMIGSKYDVSI